VAVFAGRGSTFALPASVRRSAPIGVSFASTSNGLQTYRYSGNPFVPHVYSTCNPDQNKGSVCSPQWVRITS